MASSRYPLSTQRGGAYFGTSKAHRLVRTLINNKTVSVKRVALQESERLDIVAQRHYGDSSLWWIIAAASNIGWGLQVPAGTYLVIPKDLGPIFNALG